MVKKISKEILRGGAVVFVAGLLGFILLFVVFALPTERMEENLKESISRYKYEGTRRTVDMFGMLKGELDNWTDSIMLMSAAYTANESLLQRTINVYRPNISDSDPYESLIKYYDNQIEAEEVTYSRYWHGYLITLKPLLLCLDYYQLRSLNSILLVMCSVLLIGLMCKRQMKPYILPFVLACLTLNPVAITQSLQFSSVIYVFAIASIILLWRYEWLVASGRRMFLFFVIIGCATSYFDLLTYPLVTFAFPVIFFLCISPIESWKNTAKLLFVMLIGWVMGYGGMWLMKWIFAMILGNDKTVFETVLFKLKQRSSDHYLDEYYHLFDILVKAWKCFPPIVVKCSIIFLVGKTIYILFVGHTRPDVVMLLYIVVAILPIIWYSCTKNHSAIHIWFAYRELVITFFALLCMFVRWSVKKKQTN